MSFFWSTARRGEPDRVCGVLYQGQALISSHLKTDSKTRKVIILESTFMPDHIKQAIAKAFFDNLRVPSLAFTSASVLALAACGRATGLVVDVGWLETTITPVCEYISLAAVCSFLGRLGVGTWTRCCLVRKRCTW
jgi:actin-related protein